MPIVRGRWPVEADAHDNLVPLEEVQPRLREKRPIGLELETHLQAGRNTFPCGAEQVSHVPGAGE